MSFWQNGSKQENISGLKIVQVCAVVNNLATCYCILMFRPTRSRSFKLKGRARLEIHTAWQLEIHTAWQLDFISISWEHGYKSVLIHGQATEWRKLMRELRLRVKLITNKKFRETYVRMHGGGHVDPNNGNFYPAGMISFTDTFRAYRREGLMVTRNPNETWPQAVKRSRQ